MVPVICGIRSMYVLSAWRCPRVCGELFAFVCVVHVCASSVRGCQFHVCVFVVGLRVCKQDRSIQSEGIKGGFDEERFASRIGFNNLKRSVPTSHRN
jgi:hypothetical protein